MGTATKIRVTKCFDMEMAHALLGYDGLCKNIHGHSYRFEVCLRGSTRNNDNHPKNGMVIDFKLLKALVKENILNQFEHALVLNQKTPLQHIDNLKAFTERTILVNFQPTCENLCAYFSSLISNQLPENIELISFKLFETATSFAEWYKEDQ